MLCVAVNAMRLRLSFYIHVEIPDAIQVISERNSTAMTWEIPIFSFDLFFTLMFHFFLLRCFGNMICSSHQNSLLTLPQKFYQLY
mmetsp:Transcript_8400/g.17482  ORF Transcript_8400/g.17482 Transcript_8400/m.17482 type:complete len:85 (+) Transcript_8400:697-951(+)